MNKDDGFTLPEVLVVLVIMSLLLLLVLPDLGRQYEQLQLQTAAINLHSDLRWAQGMANATEHELQIFFERSNGKPPYRYQIKDITAGHQLLKQVELPASIHQCYGADIYFRPHYGFQQNGHIQLGSERRCYYLYYYSTGRIRLSRQEI